MSADEEPKVVFNNQRGLLTEDASVVEVHKEGHDTLIRTSDREQTRKEVKDDADTELLHG